MMDTAIRKSLFILLGILLVEAVPYGFMLRVASPAGVERLYGWHVAGWLAWTAAAAVTIAYVLYAVRSLPVIGRRFFDLHWLKLIALPFALVTGTMEELWFRKLVMDWAAHHGAGAVLQVLASAATFGLAHGIWGVFGRQWRVAVGATLATGALGALLAIVYLLGGREVAPCVWAHMLINLAIEPWLMVAAVSAGQEGWRRSRTVQARAD
jgi:hypothetical protein